MTIWLLALVLTAIACATLYYAGAGRMVNAGVSVADATAEHFRAQLKAIEVDAAAGRMGAEEVTAAKGELAREVIRLNGETAAPATPGGKAAVWIPVALVAVLSIGTYAVLGRPDLPAAPLAERTAETGADIDLPTAIKTIEARLAADPNDARGWKVLAPIYVQQGRYTDAVNALKHLNALVTPTADSLTDQAEAEMMANGGSIAGEPLMLMRRAAELDPKHVRSLYYIAGEETRTGDYANAVRDWNALLTLGKGDEPWVVTAKNGLAFAQQELNPSAATPAAPNADQIAAMVDGLDARLKAQGGPIDDWIKLVRSRLVQGRSGDAQAAYDLAIKAYPGMMDRGELDKLAGDAGLVTRYHP